MIKLHVLPGVTPVRWREFQNDTGPRSIALDGFVYGGPRFNPRGPHANFNHHEGVSRLETRATCGQVLMAVRQGLYLTFRDDRGNADADLYVNDCDEDVSLAAFILRNPHLVQQIMNPLLNKLVFMEDMLDTTAGAYGFSKDMKALRQLMWVFSPYHRFRVSGGLDIRCSVSFRDVIDSVGERIMAYITGNGQETDLDTKFDVIGGGGGWSMVSEIGKNARIGLYDSGVTAFVSARQRNDGMWSYSVGRSSPFVPFPVPKIIKALNDFEHEFHAGDLWGGSDIIAGGPRIHGSRLTPAEVSEVVEKVLHSYGKK